MKCFMQDYLGSQPQSERGAFGSAVIAGGVKMKLLAIWFCGNRSMEKGALEDRQTPGSPETCFPAAMDDRVGWRKSPGVD